MALAEIWRALSGDSNGSNVKEQGGRMTQLCFATFAGAIQRALREDIDWWQANMATHSKTNKTFPTQAMAGQHYVTVRLLKWLLDRREVVDRNGDPLFVSDAVASNWMNQATEINAAIVRRIQRGDLDDEAENAFEEICRELITYKVNDLMTELHHLISNDEQVSAAQKKTLLALCKLKTIVNFLAHTFLYACCQTNKSRIVDLSTDDGWLINKADNICPMCRKNPLTVTNGVGGTISQYQPVMLPTEPGGAEECRILVCAGCAKSKDLQPLLDDSEPTGWEYLRSIHRDYLMLERVEAAFSFSNLQAEIRDVAEALVERPSDDLLTQSRPVNWQPLKVSAKIRDEHFVLRDQIEKLADTYYFYIKDQFSLLEDSGKRKFKTFQTRVSSFYDELSDATDDQVVIFEQTAAWIARSAEVPTNSNAALVIAAFFVQNCEVFDEIS